MPIDEIVIVGAGGHAKVVLDALLLGGIAADGITVRDENTALHGRPFLLGTIQTPAIVAGMGGKYCHVAVGNAVARQQLTRRLLAIDCIPYTVAHNKASISSFAQIGPGSFIAAGAVLGPAARLGCAVIINHGAVVDHDCVVGDFAHIAPNATLAGNVSIGELVLVGAGANILPGVKVGAGAIIGAGAVVVSDVPAGEIWFGVPASRGGVDNE